MLRLLRRTGFILAGISPALSAQTTPSVAYYNPAWSPDSRTIVFESNREGRFAIYSMDIESGNLRRLTAAEAEASQPSWSPDGRRIAFGMRGEDGGDLYLMNPDGTHQVRLTSASGSQFYPSFSPDGRWIVFGIQFESRRDLYYVGVVQADGTGYRVLTDSTASSTGPRWSPAGDRIVFTRTPLLTPDPGERMRDFARRRDRAGILISIRPDGGDPRLIPGVAPEEIEQPVPSPDGRFAVYAKEVNGSAGLYLVEKATGKERPLVAGAARP